jgi:hypothetical protein
MIEWLLGWGANVNERDADGRSCLHIAAHVGSVDVVRVLLKHGANTDQMDNGRRTPLLIASWNDKLDVAKELLKASADPNLADCQGATPLSIASQKGNYDMLNELLNSGALINRSSRNPIKLALRGGFDNCAELLKTNLILQQTVVPPSVAPRTSKSYDSFRFHNTERQILATLNDTSNTKHQARGLQSSLSMFNHFKVSNTDGTTDSLKSVFYVEPSYRAFHPAHDQGSFCLSTLESTLKPNSRPLTTNNKILQILRKKFRLFSGKKPSEPHHMTRSQTDTLGPLVKSPAKPPDDTSHIFKRTSLNDYFLKNNSVKQFEAEEPRFPTGLKFKNFKKETSI